MITNYNNKVANYIIIPNNLKEILIEKFKLLNIESTVLSSNGIYLNKGQTLFLSVTNFTKSDEIKSILTEFKIDNDNKLKQHIIFLPYRYLILMLSKWLLHIALKRLLWLFVLNVVAYLANTQNTVKYTDSCN